MKNRLQRHVMVINLSKMIEDAGFEAVFAKMKPSMELYKKEFEPRIRGLQGKIKTVLEKGAALFYYPIDFSALMC